MSPSTSRGRSHKPSRGRFVGCLLGGALGDALGYPIEFDSLATIRDRVGVRTPKSLRVGVGRRAVVSDDTQMTLFTAEGMIRAIHRFQDRGLCHVPSVMERALLRWLSTQEGKASPGPDRTEDLGWLVGERRLHVRRAPGNTCLSALEEIRAGRETPTTQRPINDSKGCGAVMRAAPIGLAVRERRLAFEMGRDAGALTHGHPSGYLSSAYLAAVVFDLVRDVPLVEAMTHADALLRRAPGHEELAEKLAHARALARSGSPTPETIEQLGGGWVGEEALAIGILCALTADARAPQGVADALWRAVLHSGDSDSTGSITGNLLGAIVGVEGLPARWLEQLEMRDVIERIAADLFRVSVEDATLDHAAYPPN